MVVRDEVELLDRESISVVAVAPFVLGVSSLSASSPLMFDDDTKSLFESVVSSVLSLFGNKGGRFNKAPLALADWLSFKFGKPHMEMGVAFPGTVLSSIDKLLLHIANH